MLHLRHFLVALACVVLAACATPDRTKDWTPERFYQEAKQQLEDGNLATAIKYFEQLESRYPYGRYTEQAQLELIYAHYKDNEPALSLAAADRFIRLHPTHPNVDYAYYLKGLVNFHGERNIVLALLGSKDDLIDRDPKGTRESYEAFRELAERFPNSRYAEDARQRMIYLRDAQARYEVRVARHYFDKGAYVATVNRCKQVLEQYPRTSAIEDALGLQAKAYQEMGLTKLREDNVRVLRTNFPESKYLKEFDQDGRKNG